MVDKVEELSGKTISDKERLLLTQGADEIDLVRSGLEETMVTSFQQIWNTFESRPQTNSLRNAAFVVALEKFLMIMPILGFSHN